MKNKVILISQKKPNIEFNNYEHFDIPILYGWSSVVSLAFPAYDTTLVTFFSFIFKQIRYQGFN